MNNVSDGKLIFSEKDIKLSEDKLRAKLIKIFIDKKIDYKKFKELHRDYMLSIGTCPKKIVSDRNNLIKAITLKNSMTYKRYCDILKHILKLNLVTSTDEFLDEDGKPYSVTVKSMSY